MEAAATVARREPDRSFAVALAEADPGEPGRTLALEFVQGFQAVDASRVSARAVAAGGVGRARRVPRGYDRLVEVLARRVPPHAAHLARVVDEVRWTRGRVEVHASAASEADKPTPDGSVLEARRAIVALPLAVLGRTRFDPPLAAIPAKAHALRSLTSGDAVRLVLPFRRAFWSGALADGAAGAFLHVQGAPFPVLWCGSPARSLELVAWAGGPAADALRNLDRQALIGRALDELSTAFAIPRASIDQELLEPGFHDWSSDPRSRGAYSYPLVGGAEAGRWLAAPLEGTLFFAGEATSAPPTNGTVEGALESGFRAAHQLLEDHAAHGRAPTLGGSR
jgi:monoamine oxidase